MPRTPQTSSRIASARPQRTRRRRAAGAAAGTPGHNPAESPVAWLFSRRGGDGQPLITEAQFNAGEKLRADFWFAQMTPSVTQSWNHASGGGSRRGAPGAGVDLADNVIAAGERVRRALESVGPEHAGVLIDVCCHLKGLEDVERRAGWPRRSAKIVLSMALAALARHYGLARAEVRQPRVAAVRHWGASDYRPSLEPAADDEDTGTQ